MLQKFSQGIHITNDEGLLPIHLAAMSGFNSGIRTILSLDFKSIAKRESTELMLPLDFAIQSFQEEDSSNLDTIELLLSSAVYGRVIPRPRKAGEKYPFLPLHGAAMLRPSNQSWRELLTIYNGHIMDRDLKGRSVAHILCIPCESEEVDVSIDIEMLGLVDRQTLKICDHDGFLPLHRALANPEVSVALVKKVLSLHNGAISHAVGPHNLLHCGMLPLQIAALYKCNNDVIFELAKRTTASLSRLG